MLTSCSIPTIGRRRSMMITARFSVRATRVCSALLIVACLAPLSTASAQANKKALAATANVADLGTVTSKTALKWYDRTVTGDIKVAGSVTSTHNGGYALQSRLSSPLADTVLAKTPNGSYSMLSAVTWVTVATGPGGTNKPNSVDYWVKWAKSSRKTPADAESIPVTYRVIGF